jgi:ribulose-phosphate 3-epimerase
VIEIIPAINAKTFEEIKEKIKLIEPYFDWVHLDVADGTWTKNTIWHNAQDLLELKTSLNIEVHLMINDIDQRINDWLLPNACPAKGGVKRIIFHLSAAKDPDFVINKGKDAGKEMGIAIGPDESLLKAMHYRGKVALFQILGVSPGIAGQKIKEETFERLKELRKFCPSSIIEVDGGVNKENAKKLREAGADILAAATAIFNGNDIEKNIKELHDVFN